MNNTTVALLWVIVGFILVEVILTIISNHRDELTKTKKGQMFVEVVTKLAEGAVNEMDKLNVDGSEKKQRAIASIQTSLTAMGIKNVPVTMISGAIELAVSSMHLAYNNLSKDNSLEVNPTDTAEVTTSTTTKLVSDDVNSSEEVSK